MGGKKKTESPIKDPLVEDENQSGDQIEELGFVDDSPSEETSDSGDSGSTEENAYEEVGRNTPELAPDPVPDSVGAPLIYPRNKSRPQ